jgi:ATP-binding cassette subfamily B protein
LFGYVNKRLKHSKLVKFDGFSDAIQLVDISYSHSSTRESITDINLNIPKNSYIAFVGPSGSGKTTCVDVILGLLKPFSGNVMVDNQPLNKIDLNSFLDRVGYVQQTPFLFNGTIRDNLLWSFPSATESEMWDALHLANIDSFIRSTKQQLDTQVGDRGVSLSGGQKQRIVLAQALIRKPDILVLDEATNSLDRESETSIIKTLQKISHNITIISITHHPFMTVNADQIFVFDGGRIIESGTYDELMSIRNSFLQKMNP